MLVAAHKDYWMPPDPIYKPIQVGAAGKAPLHPEWLRDDTGDQISRKNAGFYNADSAQRKSGGKHQRNKKRNYAV